MKVLVAGSSGFIGAQVCPGLEQAGHHVRAMTRHPDTYSGAGEPVHGDVGDEQSLLAALSGCDMAYYFAHSLGRDDFERHDAQAALRFGGAAARAGIARIAYLGGLGDDGDGLSAHLRSRREVETLLGRAGVPVTTLRAGVIVGAGGISWEMNLRLVQRLPVLPVPKWVHTRAQPIAVADVVRYLLALPDLEATAGRTFDIGGPDVR